MREDYSDSGDAWNHFSHDQARSLFYEFFHGDNGAGLGASHQTGWTGIIARLMHLFASTSASDVLERGKTAPVSDREAVPVRA